MTADEAQASALLGGPVTLLGAGATCVAYSDGGRAVRLARPGTEPRFEVDAEVRRALLEAGVPTPEPLSSGVLPDGRPFSVDGLARGDGAGPGAGGWQDLGRALGVLHRLPCAGFGLLENRSGALTGLAPTPEDGLCSRLQVSLRLEEAALAGHPLVRAGPELGLSLMGLRADLEAVIHQPAAVCHTDLHAGQFRWRDGRLAALLDFGDASVGPPAWDVASLAFFHGWEVAGRVADAAGLSGGDEAALFGLWLALHHARRAMTLERPARLTAAVTFARDCLERL